MRFLLLTVGLPGDLEATDEQTATYLRQWGEYMQSLAERGVMEAGLPLDWTGKTVSADSVSELELRRPDVGGYMVVKAASMDEAIEIARQAPHMALGGTTIIRPALEPPAQGG